MPDDKWRKFIYDHIIIRNNTSLNITSIKDKFLVDLDDLPEPDELALDIVENLEGALETFKAGLNTDKR